MHQWLLVVFIAFITAITIVGDANLKFASHKPSSYFTIEFAFGLGIYIVTAFLWVVVFREAKFAISGMVYSILSLLLFVVYGALFFQETLTRTELLGLGLGVSSLLMLARFL